MVLITHKKNKKKNVYLAAHVASIPGRKEWEAEVEATIGQVVPAAASSELGVVS